MRMPTPHPHLFSSKPLFFDALLSDPSVRLFWQSASFMGLWTDHQSGREEGSTLPDPIISEGLRSSCSEASIRQYSTSHAYFYRLSLLLTGWITPDG